MVYDQLWSTWRSRYIRGAHDAAAAEPDDGLSLFERILAAPGDDLDKGIVRRGVTCFVLMNRFPYTSGHLMVLPNRALPNLEDLNGSEFEELWSTVRDAVLAIKSGLRCDAVNVGVNLGPAAGGSQSKHLHVHCVPRWVGDSNFMATVAQTQVFSVSIEETAQAIANAWPNVESH